MIITIGLVNIHHLIYIQQWRERKKNFFSLWWALLGNYIHSREMQLSQIFLLLPTSSLKPPCLHFLHLWVRLKAKLAKSHLKMEGVSRLSNAIKRSTGTSLVPWVRVLFVDCGGWKWDWVMSEGEVGSEWDVTRGVSSLEEEDKGHKDKHRGQRVPCVPAKTSYKPPLEALSKRDSFKRNSNFRNTWIGCNSKELVPFSFKIYFFKVCFKLIFIECWLHTSHRVLYIHYCVIFK